MPKATVLRQQVYEQIKHEIITCVLAPGSVLSDGQFVDRFKVSKTPIREALTSLVQDGLVEYEPNRGFRVTSISVKDIQEIFDARAFFETAFFKLAVEYVSDAEIDQLETLSVKGEVVDGISNVEYFMESNLKFHLALAAAARNTRLLWYYSNLMNQAQRLFYLDISYHKADLKWGYGHNEIIKALRDRDEAEGVVAIQATLEQAKKRTLGI